MKDELHKQILERLADKLDGNLFEACVVDLLQPVYPSLTPVEGGGDDGRDGHFFTINGATGPLVCTTRTDVIASTRLRRCAVTMPGQSTSRSASSRRRG